MKGVISNYHHSYTFFFVVLILFRHVFSIYINTLSSTESLTISNNRTIVSLGDVFELGFFKPESSRDGDRWYVGIWYKAISERTYVWVANRDNPLSNSVGTLKISDTNLVLLDQSNISVWSTNLTGVARSPLVAELFANGNFVLRDSKINGPDGFLWQSFDFPTDTLLPQMKLGWDLKTGRNRFLRSWKSPYDPSSGDLSYKLENRVLPEFFIRKRDSPMFRSGPWDGIKFSGMPDMQQWSYINIVYDFTKNREEATYSYRPTNQNIYSRLTMSSSGLLQLFTWSSTSQEWNLVWFSSKDECDIYGICSPNAYCDVSTSPACNCIRGFQPRNEQNWVLNGGSGECVRKTQLSCNGGDGFYQLKKVKLPDTTMALVDTRIGLKECEVKCLANCNCTAYANMDIRNGGSGCVIWTRELEDIRTFAAAGQDLYVRLASADLVFSGKKRKSISGKNISLIVGVSLMLLLSFTMFYVWKRKHKLPRAIETSTERNENMQMNEMLKSRRVHLSGEDNTEILELPLMDFEAVAMATDNFSVSNKLGEGGFGIVYKGRLLDGQEIAVKRLSKMSLQGTNEFKNEVKLIANLQHINLVRLLGCFIDANEKILVYEYLEKLSLDFYLFDKALSSKLNWQRRFDITNGIARGLLYLHQDSRCRIIHRDLKASNILLDKDLTPKISDFGMARIFGRDEMEANTRRIVGTYGYMSPEYAMDGIFSVKSDVFSFGIVILEIVSGRRNRGFYNSSQDTNLLNYVWRHWKEGKGLEIVDPIITSSSSLSTFRPHEILRCIQIGLLCVQECAEDRPTMSSVVLMLGSETTRIPQPKPPGYCFQRIPAESNLWSTTQRGEESCTVNQITLSVVDAR